MFRIVALLAFATLAWVTKGGTQPPEPVEGEGDGWHKAYLVNADGTRSTTWQACYCSIGRAHDASPAR